MNNLTEAQQLWMKLGLPFKFPRHKNGGPMNGGRKRTKHNHGGKVKRDRHWPCNGVK